MAKTSALDRITSFLASTSGNVELSVYDRKILNRARASWELELKLFTRGEIAARLMETFNIKRATAYKDIDFSHQLFSNPNINEKRAKRELFSTVCLRRARMAEELGNDKAMQKWMDLYGKYNLLDKDDPIVPNYDKLEIADILTGIDPRLERYLIKLIDKEGPTDLTKLYDDAIKLKVEDVEYEEVSDELPDELPIN